MFWSVQTLVQRMIFWDRGEADISKTLFLTILSVHQIKVRDQQPFFKYSYNINIVLGPQLIFLLVRGLKKSQVNTSCSQTEIQGTIQHILQGAGIPYTRRVSHTKYLAHGNSKDKARGRSRYKNHSNRLQNMEGRNVGIKRGNVPNKA